MYAITICNYSGYKACFYAYTAYLPLSSALEASIYTTAGSDLARARRRGEWNTACVHSRLRYKTRLFIRV